MIRDVAWIADTIAHDNYIAEIYKIGPTDLSQCERCEHPMSMRDIIHRRWWRHRLLCAQCWIAAAGRWDRFGVAGRKALGLCVTCGQPKDRADRVACERCRTNSNTWHARQRRSKAVVA